MKKDTNIGNIHSSNDNFDYSIFDVKYDEKDLDRENYYLDSSEGALYDLNGLIYEKIKKEFGLSEDQ